jgi:hypothetical protein
MKMSRSKIIASIVVLVGLGILLVVAYYRDRTGNVGKITELPRFGPALPLVDTGTMEYEYNPRIERVLARGNVPTNVFFSICAQLKLQVIQYGNNFPRSEMIGDFPRFAPVGPEIWYGFGKLRSTGRTTIHVYYEPPSKSTTNYEGTLYLHLL